MNDKVRNVLDNIVERFADGKTIPKAIALSMFPVSILPMNKWSLMNQIICYLTGLTDFRGFQQWREVNRFVKKGEHATYILVPRFKKNEEENKEEKSYLIGFLVAPVFAVEQTQGEELEYQKLELPPFPLIDRAKELGVNVEVIPGNYEHYGYYSPTKNIIALASPEECVFFHELCHLADDKLNKLKVCQDPLQEIVAELGSFALCKILSLDGDKHIGTHYRYIERYAKDLGITAHSAVIRVLSRTEKVLKLILKAEEQNVLAQN